MEIVPNDRQLAAAIIITEFNLAQREKIPTPSSDDRFLFRYIENLQATSVLLRAIQNPSSCANEQLLKIMMERPEVVGSVSRFIKGQFVDMIGEIDDDAFMEDLLNTTFRIVHPEVANKA